MRGGQVENGPRESPHLSDREEKQQEAVFYSHSLVFVLFYKDQDAPTLRYKINDAFLKNNKLIKILC